MTDAIPRVGDLVRLTVPGGGKSPGEYTIEGHVYHVAGTPYVGGCRIGTPGRTVEILERALPPEPPVGKRVIDRFNCLWEREDEAGWCGALGWMAWPHLLCNRGPLRHVEIGDEIR